MITLRLDWLLKNVDALSLNLPQKTLNINLATSICDKLFTNSLMIMRVVPLNLDSHSQTYYLELTTPFLPR
jgi:hypothetical protein